MTNKPKLNPKILDFLHERLRGKPVSSIRSDISVLKRKHPAATLNAVAQIYAEQHGLSVRRMISKEDKLAIPAAAVEKVVSVRSKPRGGKHERAKVVLDMASNDIFLNKHVAEINRAYNTNCFTCVFVLTRKVFENLIIRILKAKYPADPELYLDAEKNRNQDFSVVLNNLYIKRGDFGVTKKEAIERLNQKLKPFKSDANDKVHSLYHMVENRQEIDDWNLDTIMALIREIM